MKQLRKGGPGNRRWVTSHEFRIEANYLSLDELISRLSQAQKEFVSTPACSIDRWYPTGIFIRGDRYATQAEVKEFTDSKQKARLKELRERRDRINSALDVLRQDAPGILSRNDLTADDLLEETAV